nr:MAG TPA: hypothetical protein [Caudoviricetes sp.]
MLPQLLYLSRIATTYYASGTMFFYEIVKPVIFSTPLLLMYLSYYLKGRLSSTFFKKILFVALGIFLWIPEPPLELADRLSLSTRLSYYP